MKFKKTLLLLVSIFWGQVCARLEPYAVLGLNRKASTQEIRKTYKSLAKEWHPDKNDDPDAQSKFVEINAAYELLSDPERRRNFDNYGITEDSPNFKQRHDYSQYGRFDSPFDFFGSEFFGSRGGGGGGGFRYHFGGGGSGDSHEPRIFHKQSITSKAYYNTVFPNSDKQPYLILFYSDWCFTCLRVEPIWTKLTEELEPVGFGVATVHTEHEKELARKIGAKELPHMILLIEGKVIHYKDPQFSAIKTLEFVRRKFPYKLVERVDDKNVDPFLNGWVDNRVRVLLFGKTEVTRLRYLTLAFKFRERAQMGYVQLTNKEAQGVIRRFGVPKNADTLLLFQEDTKTPVASLSMNDLSLSTLVEVVESHQFLQLPRLSSQGIFDQLCPSESARTRKRLCVVLITPGNDVSSPEEELKRQSLRAFVSDYKFSEERVRFTYVLKDRQADFVHALVDGSSSSVDNKDEVNMAIVWRRNAQSLKYEWLPRHWTGDVQDNQTREDLRTTLQRLLSANEVLSHETEVRELFDEHATSLFVRIANKMIEVVEAIRENITKDELLPAISLVVTVGFIIVGGYVMSYLVKMEEESVQRQLGAKGLKVDRKSGKVVPELKVHELRAETYNGMVRLLKPGCRTVVLIVDRESKEKLVPKFYKLAWPYRRNKTLMFGFLYIEKGLPWFKKILNLTLPEPRDININPKNCIGTVLSLNGHRRYFCMYHAKHPEGSRRKVYTANNGAAAGAFMGFDSDIEDSGSDGEMDVEGQPPVPEGGPGKTPLLDSPDHLPIFEDQLLDGLQLWMDRLFEGSTYRYHINYWPEFPISPANFSSRHYQQ